MTELTKWLQNTITGIETVVDDKSFVCDEIVFKIDVVKNVLTAFKVALASLEAEPVVPVMYKRMKLLTKEGLELIRDGIAEATGLEAMCMAKALLSVPSVPVVPEEISTSRTMLPAMNDQLMMVGYVKGWNACRAAMLKGKGE
ncbi:hypothetical protein ACVBCQ_004982 [Escherichia albertii]|uniref:hypothetical protein n=1 Tax=Escherichia albertii TaxID=208962 RepID=UPI000B041B48|nr:hypothetical protein [Escherichia albertii]MCU7288850.1 hypothetical protein [Escherichia albertii]MCZ8668099.1 hypothetical protein [Escherichia albertii]MCZ8863662.1 hypothetical protein [Escherichia albertii]WDB72350.1 hypothetical protein PS034_12375 [Escherichia albertii]WDB80905.1 hypothetical protein PS039_09995 [Escherichia albertii]